MKAGRLRALTIADGRLRSGWRVALYAIAYLAVLFATQLPILTLYVGYLMFGGIRDVDGLIAATQPDALPLWLYLALKSGELVMLLPLTYVLRRWIDRRPFVTLGFQFDRCAWFELILGLVLGGAQMATILLAAWAGGWLSVGLLGGEALSKGLVDALLTVPLFLLVSVGEELTFRGYIQVNLQEGIRHVPALLVTALAFGLFHAVNPNLSWLGLVNLVLAGLAMGYGRIVTGRLWLPIAYHLGWNYVQGALLALPVSGVRYGGLLAVVDHGTRPLITGAAFGPEGGLLGTAALLSCFPLFWLWGRRQRSREPGADKDG